MPLSSRELTLVLRARDEASRVLRGVGASMGALSAEATAAARASFMHGQALATVGIAVAGAGALAIYALNSMTDAAMAYNQEATKTLTQTDQVKVSLAQVKQMGIDVGRALPVAFDQIQPALYDIFSSIDVNAPQAANLLLHIGKAAVGGAVDMQTAGRITLAILNAWKLGANGVTHVNDVMFQLVRKGVGTYDEFGKSLGRAVPSALKAGQSVESLAGMMAFLTRNGLSTSMAATSAARAFDAMSNPKAGIALKELGINVADANGKFRPMVDIATELRDKLAKLTPVARAAKLQEIFKGAGGTIQAMRFFNLAVSDSHGLLQQMTKDMYASKGAADAAYAAMANTPQAQIQLLSNRYQAMAIVVGDILIPIKMKLVQIMSAIVGWFLKLSPALQTNLVRFAAIAAAVAVLAGGLLVAVGLFAMFSAAITLAGISLGAVAAIVGGVVLGLAALVAIGVLVYKNWDTIRTKGIEVWNSMLPVINAVINAVENFAKAVTERLGQIWSVVGPAFVQGWQVIVNAVVAGWNVIKPYWDMLLAALQNLHDKAASVSVGVTDWLTRIWTVLAPIVGLIVNALNVLWQMFVQVFGAIIGAVASFVGNVIQVFAGLINFLVAIFTGNWQAAWQAVLQILQGIWGAISAVFVGARDIIWGIVEGFIRGIIQFFQNLWAVLVGHSIIPDMINAIIHWFATLPGRVFSIVASLVSGVISWFANLASRAISAIASMASQIWSWFSRMFSVIRSTVSGGIVSTVSFFATLPWKVIMAVAPLLDRLINAARSWMVGMLSSVRGGWGAIGNFFTGLPSRILSALGNLGSLLWNAGSQIIGGLLDGLRSRYADVQSFVSGIGSWIASHKGPKSYDLKLLRPHGGWIMSGLQDSMEHQLPNLRSTLAAIAREVSNTQIGGPTVELGATGGAGAWSGPEYGGRGGGGGTQIPITVNTQEIDPRKHAADLGYEIAGRLGM